MKKFILKSQQTTSITFANSLDPDQGRQNVGPDLDPNSSDALIVFLKEFFEKVYFEKSADDNKSMKNYPACRVKPSLLLDICASTWNLVLLLYAKASFKHRVPTSSGNHGKPGKSHQKLPCMGKSWNLKKP